MKMPAKELLKSWKFQTDWNWHSEARADICRWLLDQEYIASHTNFYNIVVACRDFCDELTKRECITPEDFAIRTNLFDNGIMNLVCDTDAEVACAIYKCL